LQPGGVPFAYPRRRGPSRSGPSPTARRPWGADGMERNDVSRCVSLLGRLPEVDPDRIGVTGISWGGYLTGLVAGLDDRLKAAVPVYGCRAVPRDGDRNPLLKPRFWFSRVGGLSKWQSGRGLRLASGPGKPLPPSQDAQEGHSLAP